MSAQRDSDSYDQSLQYSDKLCAYFVNSIRDFVTFDLKAQAHTHIEIGQNRINSTSTLVDKSIDQVYIPITGFSVS